MQKLLTELNIGETVSGFELVKKEYVEAKSAFFYTLKHKKTGADLLYFDRADENKTFCVSFKTLPEDSTGVFHILEHSVLCGSEKFPAKDPFVSLLQSSMQTFLNAMTYGDKTVYPVSSRNERDLFNLMKVYLDAVFRPLIYKRPEIFMQEGWHYEFENENAEPYYNGVVYSEMKGVFADVDSLMADETEKLLFPDNSYGFVSGGHPDNITDLTYKKFIETHSRFYHPTNARFIFDGHLDIAAALEYIDGEYLSKYDYKKPDFDFVPQVSKPAEATVEYEAREGEENFAQMTVAKILCLHSDAEKIYATKILADYLTSTNEAPLKRAFLENGLAQDISLEIGDGIFQPFIALVVRNTDKEKFAEIKKFLPEAVKKIIAGGLNKEALRASLELFAFGSKEIREPYGIEIVGRILDGWLYGDDPLTYVDVSRIFDSLRKKIDGNYFEDLLCELFGNADDKSYLYALPSLTKGKEDAEKEAKKVAAAVSEWSSDDRQKELEKFAKMQEWQQTPDGDEVLTSLPHLDLADIPRTTPSVKTELSTLDGIKVLATENDTNGIAYLNLFFDISDFSIEELRLLGVLTLVFGELSTENCPADVLQNKIKAVFGRFSVRTEYISKRGDLEHCRPYLRVATSFLEENAEKAISLICEILLNGRYSETDRIAETVMQNDYFMKQSLIGSGHTFAITKALSAFSAEGRLKELLDGESFVAWFSDFAENFEKNAGNISEKLAAVSKKAFAKNRLFVGVGGKLGAGALDALISALPENEKVKAAEYPVFDKNDCTVEIPSDVGYSGFGHNLYALGGEFSGSAAVMASLMTFGYLWGAVRVQGGAYGTGMNIRANGDIFCYSYRDPNLENSKAAFCGTPEFLSEFVGQKMPLDDIIIGTVNTTDPLLDPSGVCELECFRYLKGSTPEYVAKLRGEILDTKPEDLEKLIGILEKYAKNAKFCAIGNKNAVKFVKPNC